MFFLKEKMNFYRFMFKDLFSLSSNYLSMCVHVNARAWRAQKKVTDLLKLQLQVSLGVGNWTQILLHEQHKLWTAESSLQPQKMNF